MKSASHITVDVDYAYSTLLECSPIEAEKTASSIQRDRPVANSLSIDVVFLLTAGVASYLFGYITNLAISKLDLQIAMVAPPQQLMFFSVTAVALVFLLLDSFRAILLPSKLPACSPKGARSVYARRLHCFLAAFFFDAMVIALGWSAATMPLFSKFFIAAVFSLALYALSQSIPSLKLSFWLTSSLFLTVLTVTQSFILLSLRMAEQTSKPLTPPTSQLRTQPKGAIDP